MLAVCVRLSSGTSSETDDLGTGGTDEVTGGSGEELDEREERDDNDDKEEPRRLDS